jgi:hypothetical protein
MAELSDTEWEQEAGELTDTIIDLIDGKESDMIMEVIACIVADILEPFEVEESIPLMLAFLGNVLEKRYDLGFDVTKINAEHMQ